MAEISMRDFCAALYCAYTAPDAFAVTPDRRIAFTALVTDAGASAAHRVEFTDVRGVTRRRDRPAPAAGPGERLELSVVELEREPDGGGWRVWLNPNYLEEIEFWCGGISLDGATVTGEGRWLQDELRDRSAV